MSKVENLLENLVKVQNDNVLFFAAGLILATALVGSGISDLQMSSDLNEQLPEVQSTELEDKVEAEIGGSEGVIFIYEIDFDKIDVQTEEPDVRRPDIVASMKEMENRLESHHRITEVRSPSNIFATGNHPQTLQGSKELISQTEGVQVFFNEDYTASYLFAETRFPSQEERINQFEQDMEDIIDETTKPGDANVRMTGLPMLRVEINELLRQDLLFTTSLSVVGLLIVAFAFTGSVKEMVEIVSPLAIAMIWLFGTAGHLGIPITISTVVVGAMTLGLGMEYGAFLVERYYEAKDKASSISQQLEMSVPMAGDSIFGSGFTAAAGFTTLLAATIPMLQQLGLMLALGIIYSLSMVIIAGPLIIRATETAGQKIANSFEQGGIR